MARHTEDHIAALRTDIVSLVRPLTGQNEQHALNIASGIIEVLRARLGGERIYFARINPIDDQRILADFTGRNWREVCRKHGISKSRFYRILNRQRHRPAADGKAVT